jgi:hypothetical protein
MKMNNVNENKIVLLFVMCLFNCNNSNPARNLNAVEIQI